MLNSELMQLHSFPGKTEVQADKLRSILSQLEYQYQIDLWETKGVPFRTHLHVPEEHPLTGSLFCEREDEGNVFKVYPGCMFYTNFIV